MSIFKNKLYFLIFIIFLITSAIYGYLIFNNKGYIKVPDQKKQKINDNLNFEKGITKFYDVEYKTTDEKNRSFITKGIEAYVEKNKPSTIYLKKVRSYAELNDGTLLNINSNRADYNKNSKNIKYYEDVIVTNKDIIIRSKIANYIKNKNLIVLKDNVSLKDKKNLIKGDLAEFNTITNEIKISMFEKNNKVYGKRKK